MGYHTVYTDHSLFGFADAACIHVCISASSFNGRQMEAVCPRKAHLLVGTTLRIECEGVDLTLEVNKLLKFFLTNVEQHGRNILAAQDQENKCETYRRRKVQHTIVFAT